MGFNEINGNIGGIPTKLYHRMYGQSSGQKTRQEHLLDEYESKLDTDGLPVLVDEQNNRIDEAGNIIDQGCQNVAYAYVYNQYLSWTVKFATYLSKEESEAAKPSGKIPGTGEPYRAIKTIEFMEPWESQLPIAGDICGHLYNHQALLDKIPDGWVADE